MYSPVSAPPPPVSPPPPVWRSVACAQVTEVRSAMEHMHEALLATLRGRVRVLRAPDEFRVTRPPPSCRSQPR